MSVRLVVFADDWGRSPSSCQHLIRQLLPKYSVLWVNTIGTRRFRWSRDDLGKAANKLQKWILGRRSIGRSTPNGLQPDVVNPLMFPGFRTRWQRRFNARQISKSVHQALGNRKPGEQRVAITTIPIAADLPERLDVDAWVYYCVDDFSVWPGLDGAVIDEMERKVVSKMDRHIAVSETLQIRLGTMGADASLLTHGIDTEHWEQTSNETDTGTWTPPEWWIDRSGPKLVFWGVVDRRLDTPWCLALAEHCGLLVLFGPTQEFDPLLKNHPNIILPGPVPYGDLPQIARHAAVLVMPYADLPVTRAIQPLKFKEYLATGRPVVARRLPAITEWEDAADLVDREQQLVDIVRERIQFGVPTGQKRARCRLAEQDWAAKAAQFEQSILSALSQKTKGRRVGDGTDSSNATCDG